MSAIEEQIEAIPKWKRTLLCLFFQRKKWKTALAYNAVAVDMMNCGNFELGEEIAKRGAAKWASIYGLEAPEIESEQWQARATIAESHLEIERRLRELRERELQLCKNTAMGLKALRKQRVIKSP